VLHILLIDHMTSATKQQRLILVTGANKGIGFEVVKKLLQQSASNNNDIILLGSRDLKRGQDALQQLDSPSNVHVLQLDTSSKESITAATNEIKQKYGGHSDIIVNNAAIGPRDDTIQAARETLNTNYFGVKILNEHLIHLLRDHGRVVNVASGAGPVALYCVSKDLREKYSSSTLTSEQLDRLVEDYLSAFESNNTEQIGYPTDLPFPVYSVSKAALIALTRIEARQYSNEKNIFVYSVCPGFCSTDLNNHAEGGQSAAVGAEFILYVVNAPEDELENGAFYKESKKAPQICMDESIVHGAKQMSKKLAELKK
jgi:carbonyl reductase 1